MPLRQVLKKVQSQTGARVLGFRFKNRGSQPVYQMKILGKKGQLLDLVVDARSARILEMKGK